MYLRFNDGVTLRTDGPYRITRKRDGYYVVGRGTSIPANDRQDAEEILADMKSQEAKAD